MPKKKTTTPKKKTLTDDQRRFAWERSLMRVPAKTVIAMHKRDKKERDVRNGVFSIAQNLC